MTSKIVIGNWKLNPLTLAEAKSLAGKIDRAPRHTAVICPPTPFLGKIDYPNLGAQDCFWKIKGPYTGQSSPAQLKSLGVKYCLVGHSERRVLGETDQEINAKILALQEYDITPILCIGFGTEAGEDEFAIIETLQQQLEQGLKDADHKKVIVAYEPVWAISSGDPYATKKIENAEHAEKIAIFIKTKYEIGTVIYGGSSNATNAKSFLEQPHIDGLLPGGASLLADDFNQMINLEI
jgi:triosephosphate isomerase (TIM)